MRSSRRILFIALIITAVCTSNDCSATSSSSSSGGTKNLTKTTLREDEDKDLSAFATDETTEFRERYRRLIPYMTFYVSNNYVNPQSQTSPSSSHQNRFPQQTVQRRPYFPITPGSSLSNDNKKTIKQQYYVNPPIAKEKFIPSVQYDPKDMDNEEFFTPVRYNQKSNFDDYQASVYRGYQNSEAALILAQGTVAPVTLRNEQQLLRFTTARPTTINFTPSTYGSDILVRKQTLKPVNIVKQEFATSFSQRPIHKPFKYDIEGENYSADEFEPFRYVRPQIPQPFRLPENPVTRSRNPGANLNHIVKSLQLTNQLPEILNADNIDNSIKTLVEILSLLNTGGKNEPPLRHAGNNVPSKYREFHNYEISNTATRGKITGKRPFHGISRPMVIPVHDQIQDSRAPELSNGPYRVNIIDVEREYLPTKMTGVEKPEKTTAKVVQSTTTPSSYVIKEDVDDGIIEDEIQTVPLTTEEPALNYPPPDGAASHTQNFPPTSIKYGATRGKPYVDYPAFATIPKTEFSCTDQRYKGFFGDPDTGCQVWHYCDLNGGKSSFLCPNGTIFSQVALTCDWWFNVKCESTTQLYVLNERLYKYILPVMPKFPEDFSGPEVDRYLELKFKEMETKLREKKLRKHQEELDKMKNGAQMDSSDTE